MKKTISLLPVALLCFAPLAAHAGFTVNLDAGKLTSSPTAPMQADNNSPSSNGSLLLLIDLGAGNNLSNILSAGSYVSGNNFILGAGGFNTNGGASETQTAFNITTSATTGDEIALRWFPQITLAQFKAGAVTQSGQFFGTYNPSGGNPDGGDTWTVPSAGAAIALDFFTTDSGGGGSQLPTAGLADLVVGGNLSVVPEPSTYALFGVGMVAVLLAQKRRRQSEISR